MEKIHVDFGGEGHFQLSRVEDGEETLYSVYAEIGDEYHDDVGVCRKCGNRRSGIRVTIEAVTIKEAYDASTMVRLEDAVVIGKLAVAIRRYLQDQETAGFLCHDCAEKI